MFEDKDHENAPQNAENTERDYSPYKPYYEESSVQETPPSPYFANDWQPGSQPPPPQPPKKRKRGGLVFVVVLLCITLSALSVGGFAYLQKQGYISLQSTSSPTATQSPSSTTDPAFELVNNSTATATAAPDGTLLSPQQAAQKVIPSVVCIQSYTSGSAVQLSGEGSGIIMSEDGYIITNAHVVSDAGSLKVILYNGTPYEATIVGMDTVTDLALIKIDATGLTPAVFADSSQVLVADTVLAIGNPGGIEFNSSVTMGIVSAVERPIQGDSGYTMHCIQTDASINPGNSGGALVNLYGQVVGINSSKIVATGFEGLGFAISTNEALPIISELKAYGYIKNRAAIGISYQLIDSMTARFYRLPEGLYVTAVNNESASNAGLTKDDIITKIDGEDITSAADVNSILLTKQPGDTVILTVYKSSSGQTVEYTVELIESTQ